MNQTTLIQKTANRIYNAGKGGNISDVIRYATIGLASSNCHEEFCPACDSEMPVVNNTHTCLVCGSTTQDSFEVAVFDSIDDSNAQVLGGGLPFDDALKMANDLWISNKYFGVEIIDRNADNMEPIVWIKSKNSSSE